MIPSFRPFGRLRIDRAAREPESIENSGKFIEFGDLKVQKMDYSPLLPSALRAIGFADVRSGILPSQSGFRRNDDGSSHDAANASTTWR
ncbi:MAG TPA: hypothetical protein VFJ01_07440 [Oleiagrimonas sp.]|nr:hypothetical protein [Oleiagrimonas sp.]